jgi:hypothetical protein
MLLNRTRTRTRTVLPDSSSSVPYYGIVRALLVPLPEEVGSCGEVLRKGGSFNRSMQHDRRVRSSSKQEVLGPWMVLAAFNLIFGAFCEFRLSTSISLNSPSFEQTSAGVASTG